ncbi:hypothetical protein J6590_028979 [Homalodisca vitripennis]|nr:hypothetical protein J6590_028979 [Homalodisca vitripennis]
MCKGRERIGVGVPLDQFGSRKSCCAADLRSLLALLSTKCVKGAYRCGSSFRSVRVSEELLCCRPKKLTCFVVHEMCKGRERIGVGVPLDQFGSEELLCCRPKKLTCFVHEMCGRERIGVGVPLYQFGSRKSCCAADLRSLLALLSTKC